MTSMIFQITEHTVVCPRLRKSSEIGPLSVRLAVKQYSPLAKLPSTHLAVTIVAAHANGFPKELYEPMWCHLYRELALLGVDIRSIWMADSAFQGRSLSLNEISQFSDVSWQDHAEDLVQLMAHFRHEMKQPTIGIGHSMGGCHIATMSVIQRRLFSSMILLDPAISPPELGLDALGFEQMSLRRRTLWTGRKAAEKSTRRAFSTWNPEVLDLFMRFAVLDDTTVGAETASPPADGPVSLVTGRYQELVHYLKPTFIHDGNVQDPVVEYQTGLIDMFHMLGSVTCSVLYLCGGRDTPSDYSVRDQWRSQTGRFRYSELSGEERRVEVSVLQDLGHFLPMEDPHGCAQHMARWIQVESQKWAKMNKTVGKGLAGLSIPERKYMADVWMQSLKSKL